MRNKKILVGLLLACILLTGCVTKSRKVENIHTFAKVYGYVRWYYPSDEASQLDWNKFAVLGVQKVETARNQKELNKIILELFKPIAPALQITEKRINNSFDINSISPLTLLELTLFPGSTLGYYLAIKATSTKVSE
ncbi:MAG: hypothetical protein NTX93_02345 [Bacteroidia bacterium]|nr:hypothetical protein [Bacteroidia bacterium]